MLQRLNIFIIDDDLTVRESLTKLLKDKRYSPRAFRSAATALKTIKMGDIIPELILIDLNTNKISEFISSVRGVYKNIQIIVMTKYSKMENVMAALESGACDHLKKPINNEELLLRIDKAMSEVNLKGEVIEFKAVQKNKMDMPVIIGASHTIKSLIVLTEKVAKSDATTILIEGESGTGKELIAKSIHSYSRRADKPFIIVNCSAIPETLLETELMGYEKGAYTDAKKDKKGLLELANGGTLFLDEIGEMGVGMQAKFLRILEDKTFRRVGGTKNIKVDIRVISATNAKLKECIKEGQFREDLYYRLLVVPIYLPPIRDRKEDILPLAEHFIKIYSREFNKNIREISPEAKNILMNYSWPGNVRELRNVIERALILEDKDQMIKKEQLPYELTMETDCRSISDIENRFVLPPEGVSIKEVERCLVKQALTAARGKQVAAAKLLGLNRDSFRRRMKKYDFK